MSSLFFMTCKPLLGPLIIKPAFFFACNNNDLYIVIALSNYS